MRKKREFSVDVFYHVTSRTNDKIRIFENRLGRKIMLMVLEEAKEKYRYQLANFCIMPTHIHLLIKPEDGTKLSVIMQWVKTRSAKRWNFIHGSTDHLWGDRYYARPIKDTIDFNFVMEYIDQNPVVAGLCVIPEEWKASGAFYRANKITGLVDLSMTEQKPKRKLLSPIPPLVSRLLPPSQLTRTMQHFGAYSEEIETLLRVVKDIPKLGYTENETYPNAYLHYSTGTAEYFIYEYDGEDTLYGKVRSNVYPAETEYKRFSLEKLKKNEFLKLDFSWVTVTKKS